LGITHGRRGFVPERAGQIEIEVTEDLRFDYSEDELNFWFNDVAVRGILQVDLQDVNHSEDENDTEG